MLGTVFKYVMYVVSALLVGVGYLVAAMVLMFSPVVAVLGFIYEMFAAVGELIASVLGFGSSGPSATVNVNTDTNLPGAASGGFTTEDGPMQLHKNEAIIPLEKFPEVVGSTVVVEQRDVVEEIRMMRSVLERLARGSGAGAKLQGG
jgi:hypothetical protein